MQNAEATLAPAFRVNQKARGFRRPNLSSPGRTRTYDKAVNSRLLYQLSYRGMARQSGVELLKISYDLGGDKGIQAIGKPRKEDQFRRRHDWADFAHHFGPNRETLVAAAGVGGGG